tara:strand:- start:238 stop:4059 length:3822 start_codon:yes stop_codon:yes gene_type:complete
MDKLQRVGGLLESHRRPSGPRLLLPFEQQLCEVVGLTEQEYWYFVDKTASYNGKRPKAYDLIPDVRNDPVTIITNIVIGVVLSYVSNLLTPKPKEQEYKAPPSLQTAAQAGLRRYSPQSGFDSVQLLSELGETIPLVFAFQREIEGVIYGGIRANTKLVWSQMRSLGKGQQFKAVFILSSGTLGARPEFAGYAIGDTLLENYSNGKLALYHRDGSSISGRLRETDRYPEGILDKETFINTNGNTVINDGTAVPSVYLGDFRDNVFSGTRNPTTQSIFGNYSPLPNSMQFKLPYELVLNNHKANHNDTVNVNARAKNKKLETNFPRYAAVVAKNGNTNHGNFDVAKDDLVTYQISGHDPKTIYKDNFEDWGAEDVSSSVDADRETSDDSISIGEQYLIGTAKGVCTEIDKPGELWQVGLVKQFTFKVTEPGKIQVRGVTNTHNPDELLLIQKCAIATVTNNIKCNSSEIGIKSTVWKQISGFANVNSHPGHWNMPKGVVYDYEKEGGNITLGQLSKYIKRYSFFRLYAREAGKSNEWKLIDGGKPFAVLGRSPQPQYNFIRVNHTDAYLHEFRMEPFPGNKVREEFIGKNVNYLGTGPLQVLNTMNGYTVSFSGDKNHLLDATRASNPEWFLGTTVSSEADNSGKVISIYPSSQGSPPTAEPSFDLIESDVYIGGHHGEAGGTFCKVQISNNMNQDTDGIYFYVDGHVIGFVSQDDRVSKVLSSVLYNGKKYEQESFNFKMHPWDPNNYVAYYGVNIYEYSGGGLIPSTQVVGVTGGSGSGLQVLVSTYDNGAKSWEIWSGQNGSGYVSGETVTIPGVMNVQVSTSKIDFVTPAWPYGQNLNPYDAISDYVRFDAERASHLDGPEHEITYINELKSSVSLPYTRLSTVGVRINSSKEFSSFSQISAYLKRGLKIKRLISDTGGDVVLDRGEINAAGQGPSNIFPEIAYALLTDDLIGAGNLVGANAVDDEDMKIAAKFCYANKFFWDGAIVDSQNLRNFIFENGSYCFLDFSIKGGRFSLIPSVPYNSNYEIDFNAEPPIKALFTDGNIKDLKVTFLSPEERQLFQARVIYRHEVVNGFSERRVLSCKFTDGDSKDGRESFDLSNFCSSRRHAEFFAKYILKLRKDVDHGLSFQTTPQAAMYLKPGDYFRLVSESTHTDRFENGLVSESGAVQTQGNSVLNNQSIFYWKPGMDAPATANLTVTDGQANNATLNGCVFTTNNTTTTNRVYKVESLTYAEDGLVELAGSHVPLTSEGKMKTLQWYNSDGTSMFLTS